MRVEDIEIETTPKEMMSDDQTSFGEQIQSASDIATREATYHGLITSVALYIFNNFGGGVYFTNRGMIRFELNCTF